MLAPITRQLTRESNLTVDEVLAAVHSAVLRQGGRAISRDGGPTYEFGNALALRLLGVWSQRGARRIPVLLTVAALRNDNVTRLVLSLTNDTSGYLFYGPAVVARLERRYDELIEAIDRSIGIDSPPGN